MSQFRMISRNQSRNYVFSDVSAVVTFLEGKKYSDYIMIEDTAEGKRVIPMPDGNYLTLINLLTASAPAVAVVAPAYDVQEMVDALPVSETVVSDVVESPEVELVDDSTESSAKRESKRAAKKSAVSGE